MLHTNLGNSKKKPSFYDILSKYKIQSIQFNKFGVFPLFFLNNKMGFKMEYSKSQQVALSKMLC